MKITPLAYFHYIAVLMCFSQFTWPEEVAPKLHFDPFEQPESVINAPRIPLSLTPEGNSEDKLPRLSATMRSSKGDMANINGKIITIGQKINDFRLLEVQERSAVLIKNGKKTTLFLDKNSRN